MCGIIGYSGRENALPVLLEGLAHLEYRGYDSAGVALLRENFITVVKSAGKLSALKEKTAVRNDLNGYCGIGHTRWATHGKPNDVNSHPQGTQCVSIVHNGIIENYSAIKEFLLEKGYTFESETDTEAAAKLIDYYYGKYENPVLSLNKARAEFTGSYAIAAVFKDVSNTVFSMRKDSPLIAAESENGCFVSSDVRAVLKYTDKYYRIDEDEICVITDKKVSFVADDGKERIKHPEKAEPSLLSADKGGYAHFMIKEITEEPKVIEKNVRSFVKNGRIEFDIPLLSEKMLRSYKMVHIVACGSAMHAGLVGKYVTEQLARVPVNVEIASEFRYKNPILGKDDLCIFISQSGETADTLAALRLANQKGVHTLGVVNVMSSSVAREAENVLYTLAGAEISVASTKAYSAQLAVMYLFAVKLAKALGLISQKDEEMHASLLLSDVPRAVGKALLLKELCKKTALEFINAKSIFFIGRGVDFYLGEEAALKLKEISYIHCESYAAGELKHGTISLVSEGTPVIALISSEHTLSKMISAVKEVKARGARVFVMCAENLEIPSDIADAVIKAPLLPDIFMPFPMTTVSQLVAYYTALHLGHDVDKPRNLAKSVTVE